MTSALRFPGLLAYGLGLMLGMLGTDFVSQAHADFCTFTPAQLAALAALPDPVTRNAGRKFVQKGKVLSEDDEYDLCSSRDLYDRIVAREAQGQLLKPAEVTYYIPFYLSPNELERVKKHLVNVIANAAKGIANSPAVIDAAKKANENKPK